MRGQTRLVGVPDGYVVPLSCPRDGGKVVPVAEGTSNGWHARAVVQCVECHHHLVVAVTLADAGRVTRGRAA